VEENKQIKLEVVFQSPKYGAVGCLITIVDGAAAAKFSDVRLARDMFWAERELGNKNQIFKQRLSCIFEKFQDKTKEDIAKELIIKFEEHNIKVIEDKK